MRKKKKKSSACQISEAALRRREGLWPRRVRVAAGADASSPCTPPDPNMASEREREKDLEEIKVQHP